MQQRFHKTVITPHNNECWCKQFALIFLTALSNTLLTYSKLRKKKMLPISVRLTANKLVVVQFKSLNNLTSDEDAVIS